MELVEALIRDFGVAVVEDRREAPVGRRVTWPPRACLPGGARSGRGHGSQRLHDAHLQARSEPGGVVYGLDHVRRPRRSGRVVRRVCDRDTPNGSDVGKALGHVEDGRDRFAPA